MSALRPVAVYGLEVPAGDIIIPAVPDFPATFRITMAAIDPSAAAEVTTEGTPRATLKILHQPMGTDYDEDEDDYDEDDEDNLEALLNGLDSDEDSSEDEEANGGPSDPEKSKKARKEAALAQIKKALEEEEDEMDVDDAVNGLNGALEKARKGKARATGEEESSEEDEDADEDEDSEDGWTLEEFVICTLDPEKNYQQPLDITVTEDERVFFKVSGTHKVYLTGNYVIPQDEDLDKHFFEAEDDEEDYDLSPDEDELDDFDEDDESDELDDLEDPRITEVDSDEEAPKLVKSQKGKNKRAAESDDEGADLDSIVAKSLKTEANADGEPKLSKKQLKKLKNNAGEAVSSATEGKSAKKDEKSAKDGSAGSKSDKKVQFAKNLEQGPTPAKEAKKDDAKKTDEQGTLGVKMAKGVKIDDKKLGKGPRAKNGDRVGMRYIGKFKDGKVFDSNKKGEPFKFKLGAGEVIKGWDIGVAGMAPGGERRIIIPSSLAYGSKPPPGIPSNAELTFDVKLLTINGH